jgi:hypothetical protein
MRQILGEISEPRRIELFIAIHAMFGLTGVALESRGIHANSVRGARTGSGTILVRILRLSGTYRCLAFEPGELVWRDQAPQVAITEY